jgi:hypothetical protein
MTSKKAIFYFVNTLYICKQYERKREKQMLFIKETISNEELNSINNFFEEYDKAVETVSPEEVEEETNVSRYITSLATGCYAKSVEDIANTKVGNRVVRKRNLQQVMRESFFYGANRFGNNFIA